MYAYEIDPNEILYVAFQDTGSFYDETADIEELKDTIDSSHEKLEKLDEQVQHLIELVKASQESDFTSPEGPVLN